MRHRTGPSKKLAPACRPETACPHEFTHEDGVQLEIDCSSCAGAHDLLARNCLVGVVNAAAAGPPLDTIILRRMTHKRYRGEAVQLVTSLGRQLSALNRAIASSQDPSDKECRACSAKKERVLSRIKSMIAEDPANWHPDRALSEMSVESLAPAPSCARADECVRRALEAIPFTGGWT